MSKKIFLSPPHMSGNELKYIQKVFESNYIAPLGEYVNKFENNVKEYTGAQYALATINGTAAIHLALKVLGITTGDDVLASTFTFIGSVSAIKYQNANPIFLDSDKESWNLSANLLEKYLSECQKKPKALIVTHLYGMCADIEKIAMLCKKYDIYLIEDAAESLGATFNGRQTGTFGDFGIYSFNGNKILTTSGGGMLVSDNKVWIEKATYYATQAKEASLHYEHLEYGYNYRLSNVLAAIGVAQMEVIEDRVNKKRKIFRWYREFLDDVEEIEFMPELRDSRGNRWLIAIVLRQTNPFSIIDALQKNDIESRPLWKPMHMQAVFKESSVLLNGVSEDLFNRGVCLPSGTAMNKEDVQNICQIIKQECIIKREP